MSENFRSEIKELAVGIDRDDVFISTVLTMADLLIEKNIITSDEFLSKLKEETSKRK